MPQPPTSCQRALPAALLAALIFLITSKSSADDGDRRDADRRDADRRDSDARAVFVASSQDSGRANHPGGVSLYDFEGLSLGLNTGVNWTGVGTFDQLYIRGGNSSESNSARSVVSAGTTVTETTLTLAHNSGYFGMRWAGRSASTVLSFYDHKTLVARMTLANLALGYSGEGEGNGRGGSLNFFGGTNTTWNKVVLNNDSRAVFQAFSFATRATSYNPATDEASLTGAALARVSPRTVTPVSSSALRSGTSAVPGAPAPPLAWLLLFGVCALLKSSAARTAGAQE